MEKKCADEERWALVNSTENSLQTPQDGGGTGEEDDDEALSLCDLPLVHQSRIQVNGEECKPLRAIEAQEDFDFCSLLKESEMCAADEVFFQGQILPLRHSVSSGKELSQYCDGRTFSRSVSRSLSMDYHSSSGLITSRSSSISSHQSSSSGSSAATADRPQKPPLNIFHSHPSPSPRVQRRGKINNKKCAKKSSAWNIFRQGLVATPPKIAFHDLKNRTSSKNSGSRNRIRSGGDKKKPKANFLGGCDCLLDAVDTVPSKVAVIKRGASYSQCEARALGAEEEKEENLLAAKSPKKPASHHRTFEWLKQLSLEVTADEQ